MKKTTSKSKQETGEFFKSQKTTAVFSTIAFIGGLIFLNQSFAITGNIITKNETFGFVILLPILGTLLIICSVILALYSLKKK